MGQREDLLDGAKRCLIERGYAHTTARDITAASGANLGSIGYHFGSKEALMNEAMIELSTEVVERLRESEDASLTSTWQGLVDSFTEQRDLWTAVLETATQAIRFPELRERLADAQDEGRKVLGERLSATDADAAGAVQFALIAGVMMQHLVAPDRAPGAETIVRGLKALAGGTA
ncbi:TetR/AcrR family transcriptional regulator [Amycolatopsis keratiniphila]|uniref:TetR/AcrR family transcriptional regulator n=1 Tax=Amycolatopsis keratiniphila TaxID=129921 RepID=UPI00087CB592|nr:TetR/AcrR family transcriptional regulator [Amycolatopsis keratiniphila]OLZ58645.1 TetR family transcriptional regulator [Amycolatopsis keratiniphila subsp. nogabecina]SDU68931.1 DNA-binding transcriptional regulator, AcrR family [Amycolatopsis keratiniphila]